MGSEQVDDAIAQCLGAPVEENPDELDKVLALMLNRAQRLAARIGLLRLRNQALGQLADAPAAVAHARAARDDTARRFRVAETYAGRAERMFGHFHPRPGRDADSGLFLRSLNVFLCRWNRMRDAQEALAAAENTLTAAIGARFAAEQRLTAATEGLAALPPTGVTVEQ